MKKNLYLAALSLLLLSCSGGNKEVNVDEVVKSKDLNQIKSSREIIHKEYEKLVAELAKLDKAIAELDPNKKNPLVKTITLKDTLFNHYIEIQGNVETKENIVISPEYSGILTQLYVKAGQKVSKGQLLARIDDGGMSAQLAQAETQLALAKTTFERQKNLWDQKIGSEIQFLQAKTTLESQQKVVAQIKSQLNKTNVVAPFSGTIDEVITERGKVVAPGMDLFRIVNLSNMYVTANVPENYIAQLKLGAIVNVYLNALGKSYQGKVRQIGNYINPNNRTFSIEIALPNPDNLLRPNQVAVLKIEDYKNPKALLLTENILQETADGSKIVYVVNKVESNNTAKVSQKKIEIGYTSGSFVEVKSGLESGEMVVTDGAKSLKDGITVEIIK
ncbi:efflux RND transporter periplasmic adaptor subunit [Flavobacterium piscinae]|uniref:Efflux RND transporter periplasmic adaptor subunit n=1 Tax=Flavobacterium piscinae TaxID=2506424 RepID=A0A4Q1KYP1_9FLAO|nr:efflux RND transporter periplasmic adaptor subunit [Flavobacterium piscinae]RXR35367.1 efflux RND transporter periplasmic adaptor subunit [Flavobacterium piscinae]